MKKIIFFLTLLCVLFVSAYAAESSAPSSAPVASASQSQLLYSGPAYSFGSNDLIPDAGESVNVYWTTDGCTVNGNPAPEPKPVSGDGYPMKVNGKVKYMKFYVSYGGERYYFRP